MQTTKFVFKIGATGIWCLVLLACTIDQRFLLHSLHDETSVVYTARVVDGQVFLSSRSRKIESFGPFEKLSDTEYESKESALAVYSLSLTHKNRQRGWLMIEGAQMTPLLVDVSALVNEAAEPGATDNPDDAQRLRQDH